MLGETHKRIAAKVAGELGIKDKKHLSVLASGVIDPDNWGEFPHHRHRENEIAYNILRAREGILSDDDSWLYYLVVALHFIQDKWTLAPRTEETHTRWEEQIEKAHILNKVEFENHIKNAALPSKAVDAYLNLLASIHVDKKKTDAEREIMNEIEKIAKDQRPKETEIGQLQVEDELREIEKSKEEARARARAGDDDDRMLHFLTGLQDRHQYDKRMRDLEGKRKYWSDPTIDLNFAYLMSMVTAQYVAAPCGKRDPSKLVRPRTLDMKREYAFWYNTSLLQARIEKLAQQSTLSRKLRARGKNRY